ncbi:enhancing lycopene biosynthesis protein 2 [bacterium BMS3Bbin04]|nr:enhancing lycopene biosynthesis protein 2 [bacterium BMS3Bbin04]
MSRVAVVMAGCGAMDGTEIHEATLTLLYLDELGAEYQCYAPDKPQHHIIDHAKGEELAGERNCLVEAARIARGEILPLSELVASDYDALVFPGGFGAAKNLCDFAFKGAGCTVDSDVESVILDFHNSGKAMAFICIAPVIAAKVFGDDGKKVKLTIGSDAATAEAVEKMGAQHVIAQVDEAVVDEEYRVVSTPAYMLGPTIKHVGKGIRKAMEETVRLAGQQESLKS